jgi:hypothetical protein
MFDVIYVPVGMLVSGDPGARSMGTMSVGQVVLANGERVYVTSRVRPTSRAPATAAARDGPLTAHT